MKRLPLHATSTVPPLDHTEAYYDLIPVPARAAAFALRSATTGPSWGPSGTRGDRKTLNPEALNAASSSQ